MTRYFFITGTDTDVGKTYMATRLLKQFGQEGYTTLGLKPIASGCLNTPEGLRSDDALQLQQAATIKIPYEQVNPFSYEEPIAPHIAAKGALSVAKVLQQLMWIKDVTADVVVIEGAGGWLLPLNHQETMAQVVQALEIPVILVVGMKLGCLNHALLTYAHLCTHNISFAGWIPNDLGCKMNYYEETIETLSDVFEQRPLIMSSAFNNAKK